MKEIGKDIYTPLEVATTILDEVIHNKNLGLHFISKTIIKSIHLKNDDYKKFGISRHSCNNQNFSNRIMKEIIDLFDGLNPDALHRERQVYVDVAKAILDGATLIASASFGAWLQPPLGYKEYYSTEFLVEDIDSPLSIYESFVAIKQYWTIQLFWIFKSLSFFFSLVTMIAEANARVPQQGLILKEAVKSVRNDVRQASCLLSIAIVFVICTFATIGFVILVPPIAKYRINMYCTILIGLLICGYILLRLLVKSSGIQVLVYISSPFHSVKKLYDRLLSNHNNLAMFST